MIQTQDLIDHEVRIQLLEKIAGNIDNRFQHLENKIDSHFKWTIGTMLAMVLSIVTMCGGVMLTNNISKQPTTMNMGKVA